MRNSVPDGPGDQVRPKHSQRERLVFFLAAIPAGFLPVSYAVMVGFVLWSFVPALWRGESGPEPGDFPRVLRILQAGVCATLIQWPFYLAWAAMSRELTWRLRWLWIGYIFLLNMFAMPWFLYCKYRGTTQTAPIRGLRHKGVREWFERSA
jgi:hypothetical protein